jgi:hypothetical protein
MTSSAQQTGALPMFEFNLPLEPLTPEQELHKADITTVDELSLESEHKIADLAGMVVGLTIYNSQTKQNESTNISIVDALVRTPSLLSLVYSDPDIALGCIQGIIKSSNKLA